MGVDVMRPAFNLEPQYRVIMVAMEDWTKATGALPAVKWFVWFTDGSRMRDGTGAGVYGQSVEESSTIPHVDMQQFFRLIYFLF